MKDLYNENNKSLLKEFKEEDIIKGNTSLFNGLEDLMLSCQYYPKWSTDSIQSLSKSQWHFCRNRKPLLKFIWNDKGTKIAKTILKKKNKNGWLIFSDFQAYYKATIIKTV